MAATLRCLARTVASAGLMRNVELLKSNVSPCSFALTQVRGIRAQATPKVQDLDLKSLTDFEISKDPNEWQYVERLFRTGKTVPIPKSFEGKSPAGWSSPKEEAKKLSYFINRTKNYMQPVYLSITYRGTRHITVIRRIQGDVWECEKDIRKFLKSKLSTAQYSRLATRINEMSGQIRIRGDYVSMIKYWMDMKGY
ncbi:probable 39S ribosomal protein L49, mitochondrial isoform X1 [Nasonia vitripennis]|uniref:Large ribosomal subunit protein mL49 n=1 Tax=Nasonia vitripennis TaxID=7425 RepID=A0A7M7LJR1_NASVI|nr:probable 39S ribosomal protein L49, mitochondrial isoform X1 [Nasonia vitripennis]